MVNQDGFTCNYSKTITTTAPKICPSTYNGYTLESQEGSTCNYKKAVGKQDEKPIFEGISNLIIKAGENIELSEGVRALDSEDGDITSKINIYGTIDVNIPGDYSIIYSVEDSNGNKTIVTRVITVE